MLNICILFNHSFISNLLSKILAQGFVLPKIQWSHFIITFFTVLWPLAMFHDQTNCDKSFLFFVINLMWFKLIVLCRILIKYLHVLLTRQHHESLHVFFLKNFMVQGQKNYIWTIIMVSFAFIYVWILIFGQIFWEFLILHLTKCTKLHSSPWPKKFLWNSHSHYSIWWV